MAELNSSICISSVLATALELAGIEKRNGIDNANPVVTALAEKKLGGKKTDRTVIYNPDAVAHWLFEKYPQLFAEAVSHADVQLPLHCMMPSVTPVNFGTMYTGAAPAVHGITKYAKPVIRIDTFYDALLRAGKKPVIIAHPKCSMGNIFLEREMDYILCPTWDEVNAKAAKILVEDQYDVVIIYNGNYDARMHKTGPESIESLGELRHNVRAFAMFSDMVKDLWGHHNTFMGFAMDHGCHEIDGGAGAHGLDMPEDLNILHMYKAYPATET